MNKSCKYINVMKGNGLCMAGERSQSGAPAPWSYGRSSTSRRSRRPRRTVQPPRSC